MATQTLGEVFITTEEQLTWSELTASSKTAILEKTVIFQGRTLALNQLISAESMTDSFQLADLLQETEIRIGEEPVTSASSGYSEKYYIDRTFKHNIVIRHDISSDKREGKFSDLLAGTEQEFKKLCQQNPTSNVHFLVENKSGELFWHQTQGDLKILRRYIDAKKSHSYASTDLDKLLQQAKNQKVMLIADKAGMGKTTVLTHLSKTIKQKYPAHWLVIINLNDYTELFMAQKGKKIDKGWVLEFLSKEVLKLESHFQKELFKKSFEGDDINKVVVMVDGFDEISPNYKETVLHMLQVLKQTSLEQLWVTTRPHLKEELEDSLQQLSYTLQPFSEVEQVEFLEKFLFQTLNLEDMDQHRLKIFAITLIRELAQSIRDKHKEFTSIPLQIRILAVEMKKPFLSFYLSEKREPELELKLDFLYQRLMKRKCEIYHLEKCKIPAGNEAGKEQNERNFRFIQSQHQVLAIKVLFTEDQVKDDWICNIPREQLARFGIAQINHEGKPEFIHRIYAEYLAAEFLTTQLTMKTKQRIQVQEILLNEVLLKEYCHVVRAFLDGMLAKCEPTNKVLKEYGEKLDKQWNEREVHGSLIDYTTALHKAATEDNSHIVGFILDSLKSAGRLSTIVKILLTEDHQGQTALHMAAENGSVQALKKIWEWVEKVTAWQVGAGRNCLDKLTRLPESLDKFMAWVKEKDLKPNQLQNKLLLSKDQYGNTAWKLAEKRGSLEALELLRRWAVEVQLNPQEMMLAEYEEGHTAWQLANGKPNRPL